MENVGKEWTPDNMECLKQRLNYNNLEFQVILYIENISFEYNPIEKLIKPINSVFWYSFDYYHPGKLDHIAKLLLDRYNDIVAGKFDKLKYEGIRSNKTVVIELNDFYSKIKDDEELAREYILFAAGLFKLYLNWEDALKNIDI